AVAHVNPADKATILSQGISEAMNCTFFGLLVAIPALIMFSVLNGRTQSLINDINETSVSVLNLVVNNKDKFKNLTVSAGRDEAEFRRRLPREPLRDRREHAWPAGWTSGMPRAPRSPWTPPSTWSPSST